MSLLSREGVTTKGEEEEEEVQKRVSFIEMAFRAVARNRNGNSKPAANTKTKQIPASKKTQKPNTFNSVNIK